MNGLDKVQLKYAKVLKMLASLDFAYSSSGDIEQMHGWARVARLYVLVFKHLVNEPMVNYWALDEEKRENLFLTLGEIEITLKGLIRVYNKDNRLNRLSLTDILR